MSLTLGYESLKIKMTGTKADVPDNDLAILMYYLLCVFAIIKFQYGNNVFSLIANNHIAGVQIFILCLAYYSLLWYSSFVPVIVLQERYRCEYQNHK